MSDNEKIAEGGNFDASASFEDNIRRKIKIGIRAFNKNQKDLHSYIISSIFRFSRLVFYDILFILALNFLVAFFITIVPVWICIAFIHHLVSSENLTLMTAGLFFAALIGIGVIQFVFAMFSRESGVDISDHDPFLTPRESVDGSYSRQLPTNAIVRGYHAINNYLRSIIIKIYNIIIITPSGNIYYYILFLPSVYVIYFVTASKIFVTPSIKTRYFETLDDLLMYMLGLSTNSIVYITEVIVNISNYSVELRPIIIDFYERFSSKLQFVGLSTLVFVIFFTIFLKRKQIERSVEKMWSHILTGAILIVAVICLGLSIFVSRSIDVKSLFDRLNEARAPTTTNINRSQPNSK